MKKENWLPSMNFAQMTTFRALAGEMHFRSLFQLRI